MLVETKGTRTPGKVHQKKSEIGQETTALS